MRTFKVLGIIMGMICCAIAIENDGPIVHIGDSKIIGKKVYYSNMEANQYLGVPYAEPPIGDLRFMKTKPICKYPKVVKAFCQPKACHQFTLNPFPWYIDSSEKSEDCLYLNIWTPTDASPQNTKAVLFWIHGGGFRYGSIRDPLYTGTALASVGDIVVVTVNYRLGPFGFLSPSPDSAAGNAGMWDILEGLSWVNRNILAFGGDASRITLAGESAGAIASEMLGASPLSEGLFTRIIMESGSSLNLVFQIGAEVNPVLAQNLSTLAGCADDTYTIYDHPSKVIKCLQSVKADTLSKLDSVLQPHSTADFIPQYGDDIMPIYTKKAIAYGKLCTELLIGVARDEGSLFLTTGVPDVFGFFGEKDPQFNKTVGKDLIRKINPVFPVTEAVVNHYLPNSLPENAYEEIRRQVYTYLSDTLFICPAVYYAEKYAEEERDVYFYFYLHRPSPSPWAPWMGVAHYDEIQFVFGQPLLNPQKYQPEEGEFSLSMIRMWSNFIKYGKPSLDWPLYSRKNPVLQKIGLGTELKSNFESHRPSCELLRPYHEL